MSYFYYIEKPKQEDAVAEPEEALMMVDSSAEC
jgi:hypothetical protein